MPDPRHQITDLLRQINREFHERFRQACRDHELTPSILILMREISLEPGITVNELARRSGLVKSHVSKSIDQLVRQGLLEKRSDAADQRLQRLQMTPAARSHMQEMEAKGRALVLEVTANLPAADLEQVLRGLQILRTALVDSRIPSTGDERS